MTIATFLCLGLAWLAVFFAAARRPRLAAAMMVGTLDLAIAGQLLPTLGTGPLMMLAAGTALLTVFGTVAGTDQ